MFFLLAGIALVLVSAYLYSLYSSGQVRKMVRTLRWVVGGVSLAIAALFALGGRISIASILALLGTGVLLRGRLGPIDFGAGSPRENQTSSVSSAYFAMTLDHDTGAVEGSVRKGHFAGTDLDTLGPEQCWALLDEVEDDPDSLALYQSWLDANRAGWREYFAEHFGMDAESAAGQESGTPGTELTEEDQAYEILGLSRGASVADVKAAHRRLMQKVHPDHGGSSYLAARINQAKDLLVKKLSSAS